MANVQGTFSISKEDDALINTIAAELCGNRSQAVRLAVRRLAADLGILSPGQLELRRAEQDAALAEKLREALD